MTISPLLFFCQRVELFSMKYIRAEAEAKAGGLNITVEHARL